MEQHRYDAHVQMVDDEFHKIGFTYRAISFPRTDEALIAVKRFNGLRDDHTVPWTWGFHPNAYMRDNWRKYYGHFTARK